MSLFVTGDTHGASIPGSSRDGFLRRFSIENFPEQSSLTKDDFVVICGDFGGVWSTLWDSSGGTRDENNALDWLDGRPFTTLFVPGNHENWNRLTGIKDERLLRSWLFARYPPEEKQKLRQGFPREIWNGGWTRVVRPSVRMLEPGVFNLCGLTCFAYGGARSFDISDAILDPVNFPNWDALHTAQRNLARQQLAFRTRALDWWEQEVPDETSELQAREALAALGNTVDIIFTHDCSETARHAFMISGDCGPLNWFLEFVEQTVAYRDWYFGHFHQNVDLDGGWRTHMLYDTIVRIV